MRSEFVDILRTDELVVVRGANVGLLLRVSAFGKSQCALGSSLQAEGSELLHTNVRMGSGWGDESVGAG